MVSVKATHLAVGLMILGSLLLILQVADLILCTPFNPWIIHSFMNGVTALIAGIMALCPGASIRWSIINYIVILAGCVSIYAIRIGGIGVGSSDAHSSHESRDFTQSQVIQMSIYAVMMAISWLIVIGNTQLLTHAHINKARYERREPSPFPLIGGIMISISTLVATFQVLAFVFSAPLLVEWAFTGLWTAPFFFATGILAIENSQRLKLMSIISVVGGALLFTHKCVSLGLAFAVPSAYNSYVPVIISEMILCAVIIASSSRLVHRIKQSKANAILSQT